jgi:nucleoside-diphosphate-sugar epimerase/SAM-dependent methyltransferase
MSGRSRLVLTGATGFIGRCVVPFLLKRGHEVHALGRGRSGVPGTFHHSFDLLGDQTPDSLVAEIQPTHLLHLAWNATPGEFWVAPDNLDWVAASLRLYRAFARAGGRRAVFAGSCAEYDWNHGFLDEATTPLRPRTLYGTAKDGLRRLITAAATQEGISMAWGRIFFLYGPHEPAQRLVPSVVTALLAGELALCTDGRQERDFMHVADVARAFADLVDSDLTGPVNIASGECRSLREIVGVVAEVTGRPDLLRFGARQTPADEPPRLAASVGLLQGTLRFRPQISLREGIADVVAWHRSARTDQNAAAVDKPEQVVHKSANPSGHLPLHLPLPTYSEIPVVEVVLSTAALDTASYLAFNPDVVAAGLTAEQHLTEYGLSEGRRQFADASAIGAIRRAKLRAISFRDEPLAVSPDGQLDFLSQSVKDGFGIPDTPPIAGNDYNSEIIDLIRSNPDKLFLDVGAGLRYTYYSNVVNAEIWKAASTDVICVGEDLPFSDAQFDYVLCFAVLEHTKRPWLAARELIRVTKPNGEIRIDWPFLQPVHGYPHHFFNATPKGHTSLFEDACDIESCEVRPWQHPIFALSWLLNEWQAGLPQVAHDDFRDIRIGELLGIGEKHLEAPFCASLNRAAQDVIAAGTTLIARKR